MFDASFFSFCRLPKVGEFVLCEFEDNWSRAEVCQIGLNDEVVVAFVDYGNLLKTSLSALIPLPRQFSHTPAIATKIHIEGIADSTDQQLQAKSAHVLGVREFYV